MTTATAIPLLAPALKPCRADTEKDGKVIELP